jgi:hypothetical protein
MHVQHIHVRTAYTAYTYTYSIQMYVQHTHVRTAYTAYTYTYSTHMYVQHTQHTNVCTAYTAYTYTYSIHMYVQHTQHTHVRTAYTCTYSIHMYVQHTHNNPGGHKPLLHALTQFWRFLSNHRRLLLPLRPSIAHPCRAGTSYVSCYFPHSLNELPSIRSDLVFLLSLPLNITPLQAHPCRHLYCLLLLPTVPESVSSSRLMLPLTPISL